MRLQAWIGGGCIAALVAGMVAYGFVPQASAQDAGATAAPEAPAANVADPREPEPAKPRKRRVVHKPAPKAAEPAKSVAAAPIKAVAPVPAAVPVVAAAPAPVPDKPADKAPTDKPPETIDFAAQLDKAGASACHSQVNALVTSTMGSVVKYNTMSNWSQEAGGKRAVSVAIGQKYPDGSAVPFSVAQVISAPNGQGSCDGFTVQVFPSPLPCATLRETLATRGPQIGDLAGIPLMQDAAGRTMLVPTAANTCVLVATRTVYAK